MTRNAFRWRLLQQALVQKKAKAVIILLAVTMGASVVAALLNLQTDLRSRMNRELRDYGPNVVLQSAMTGGTISPQMVSTLESSQFVERTIAHTPQLILPVEIHRRPVLLAIVDLQAYRKLYPSHAWSFLGAANDSNAIYLGKRLAEKLRITTKQNVTIQVIKDREITLPVGGFVESGESEDDQLLISLQLAHQLHLSDSGFHSVLFSALGDLDQVKKDFDSVIAQHAGLRYQIIRKIAAAESTILDKISRLMGVVILLIFVILFFCIHTTVSTILLSRQSEIALLRVLGAKRKQITALFTSELLVLGLLGGVAGYVVGIAMAQVLGKVLFQSFIAPSVLVFVITLFFSLSLMVVSSFLPISHAVNRQAALVLKEA